MAYILSNNINNSSLPLYVLTKVFRYESLLVTSNGHSDAFKGTGIYLFKNISMEWILFFLFLGLSYETVWKYPARKVSNFFDCTEAHSLAISSLNVLYKSSQAVKSDVKRNNSKRRRKNIETFNKSDTDGKGKKKLYETHLKTLSFPSKINGHKGRNAARNKNNKKKCI